MGYHLGLPGYWVLYPRHRVPEPEFARRPWTGISRRFGRGIEYEKKRHLRFEEPNDSPTGSGIRISAVPYWNPRRFAESHRFVVNDHIYPYRPITFIRSVPDRTLGTRELIMRDVEPKSGEQTPYECFGCGSIIVSETSPGQCPDCGGSMRNRRMPLE